MDEEGPRVGAAKPTAFPMSPKGQQCMEPVKIKGKYVHKKC